LPPLLEREVRLHKFGYPHFVEGPHVIEDKVYFVIVLVTVVSVPQSDPDNVILGFGYGSEGESKGFRAVFRVSLDGIVHIEDSNPGSLVIATTPQGILLCFAADGCARETLEFDIISTESELILTLEIGIGEETGHFEFDRDSAPLGQPDDLADFILQNTGGNIEIPRIVVFDKKVVPDASLVGKGHLERAYLPVA
jgi:hypothetical protein